MSTADEMVSRAARKVGKLFFNDPEAAYDLYLRAASQYRLDKQFAASGDAYMKAGDIAIRLKNPYDACQCYTDSALAFLKVDTKRARVVVDAAVQLHIDNNKLGSAARLCREVADALEGEGNLTEALEMYEKAKRYYCAEDQHQSALQCLTKIANIHAQQDHFSVCIPLYEELGTTAAKGLLKFQAKEFFLRAILCRIALIKNDNRGEVAAECAEAFSNYRVRDPNLRHTREEEFINLILESAESGDSETFEQAVSMLQELRMLDDWKTHVLLIIKQSFEDLT